MGLDTTHDCWHGAYGGFHDFRELVGKAAGLPYRKAIRQSFEDRDSLVLDIDWDKVTANQIAGKWPKSTAPKGPVVERGPGYDPPVQDNVLYLLIHSDCDGELKNRYLPQLKARLEELEPEYERLTADDKYRYDRGNLRQFIDGLNRAIKSGEDVGFH